jgi:peptidyl-tRNA hydrolase, PTH1 family
MSEKTFLIIGLGNPGREYKDNRHNVGFMLIDRLAVRLDARMNRVQSKALVSSVRFEEQKIILAKPQTYMNLSGDSVGGLARFYKVPLEQVLVAHDDLDLPFGTIRVRPGGGPGGQKGVASAIQRLGSKDFPRLRIGIGRPPGRMDAAKYVLQDFSISEQSTLSEVLERASEAGLTFMREGVQAAMNKFNSSAKTSD